jgi:hypothetical protein
VPLRDQKLFPFQNTGVLPLFVSHNTYSSAWCFIDYCLSLWPFSFGHCISGPLIEGFWWSLWYIQPVLFCIINIQTLMDKLSIWFVPPVWELVCLLLEVKQFHWDIDTPIWPYTTDLTILLTCCNTLGRSQ